MGLLLIKPSVTGAKSSINSSDFRFKFVLVGLDPIKFFKILLLFKKVFVMVVKSLLAANHLIIYPYLLFILSIETPMNVLVVLSKLVLFFYESFIHFIESIHEFQVCFFHVVLHRSQIIGCLSSIHIKLLEYFLILLKFEFKVTKSAHYSFDVRVYFYLNFPSLNLNLSYFVSQLGKCIQLLGPIKNHIVKSIYFLSLLLCLALKAGNCLFLSVYFVNQRIIKFYKHFSNL